MRAFLAARIDRLPDAAKRLLQTASVIGKEFSMPLLERVSDLAASDFAGAVAQLTHGDFIYERALYPVIECAFKHPLTHEVAYNTQLKAQKANVHAVVAPALEVLAADGVDECAPLIAYHWEQAGEAAHAATWHRRAAIWSTHTDASSAMHHWERIRELLAGLPSSAAVDKFGAEAYANILTLGWRLGADPAQIEADFQIGKAMAERCAEPTALALINAGYAAARGVALGYAQDYIDYSQAATGFADQTDDAELQGCTRFYLSYALLAAGRFQEGADVAHEVFERSRHDGQLGMRIAGGSIRTYALACEGQSLWSLGRQEQAESVFARYRALPVDEVSPEINAVSRLWFSRFAIYAGRFDDATEIARAAILEAEASPSNFMQFVGHAITGAVNLARGDLNEAETCLLRAFDSSSGRRQFSYYRPAVFAMLAETCLTKGDFTGGIDWARQSIEFCRERHLIFDLRPWLVFTQGQILDGDANAAREMMQETEQLIEQSGSEVHRPFLHEQRAAFAARFGGEWDAAFERDKAITGYRSIGASWLAERLQSSEAE